MFHLPRYSTSQNAQPLVNLCVALLKHNETEIDCNASSLEFIDPLGLCLLASTCHQLSKNNKNVSLTNVPENIASYLSRMDLFEICHIKDTCQNARYDRSDTLLEVKRLESPADIDSVGYQIAVAIAGSIDDIDMDASPDEMTGYKPYEQITIPLQYMFCELLENALRHGRKHGFNNASVWVASQYYARNDIIKLSVVDNGCGYLESLKNHSKLISADHIGAIKTALMPEISCNRDLDIIEESANLGIGLTVVNDMVQTALGKTCIGSGNALLNIEGSGESNHNIGPWQGVIISLEFQRKRIINVKKHEVIRKYQSITKGPALTFE